MQSNEVFLELCEKLKDLDELTLIETIGLTSEEIVDMSKDIIESRFDTINKLFRQEQFLNE